MKNYLLLVCLLLFSISTYADAGKNQFDYIVETCQIVQSTMNEMEWAEAKMPDKRNKNFSGHRSVSPLYAINRLYVDIRAIDLSTIETTLLEDATHGKVLPKVYPANFARPHGTSYQYISEPKYKGRDRAVFMANFEGKHYKIVIELMVFHTMEEAETAAYSDVPTWCLFEPQLTEIK